MAKKLAIPATVTSDGKMVLPKEIRDKWGVRPGQKILVEYVIGDDHCSLWKYEKSKL